MKQNRRYFLDDLVKKHNMSTIAEVGVRDGRTCFYLLDNNPNLTVWAIDKSTDKFYNQEVAEKYGDRLKPLCGPSNAVHDQIDNESLDLVFIDASHSYVYVRQDIVNYSFKLKSEGWLTGHDIDREGVRRAVDELVVDYEIGPNNVWYRQI